MTENDVTGVLVRGESGQGIVTDHDLRERVLAAGLSGETPVGEVATRPLRVVDPGALADDALIEMLEQGVRHLPVVSVEGYLGMLEITDVVAAGALDPFDLRASIDGASTVAALAGLSGKLPRTIAAAIDSGVAVPQLGRMVASFTDALTVAALRLAEIEVGRAPVTWAWVSLGSQARREQGLITDQDHVLLYAEGGAAEDDWFARLAAQVVSTLESCGIPRCPNGVMASEPGWRSEAGARIEVFRESIREHSRGAALFAGIALDHRQIAGDLDAGPVLEEMRQAAASNFGFVVRSGELAIEQQLPIGFLGNLVVQDLGDHQGVLNIKAGGIHPVVELARFFGLMAKSPATGTMDRIRSASRAGVIDEDDGEGLIEAFSLLTEMRLRHQVERWRRGERPNNLIDPEDLGPLSRAQLKDAFGIIREVQRQVERHIAVRPR
jgi:CBS domain-containing protein